MRVYARLQDEAWSSLEAPPDGDALQLARLLTVPALACTASLAAALRALGQQVSHLQCIGWVHQYRIVGESEKPRV